MLTIKERTLEFALTQLGENIIELDRQEKFNREGWHKCGKFGILGLPIPQEYGGSGADILTTLQALEGLGCGCKDNGLIFAMNAHLWAVELPILTFGTMAQKQKYLPKLCRGEAIAAHAISEPEAGSDIYSLKTTAVREGDNYILNGRKMFVTNAPVADLILVFATVEPLKGKKGITGFLVEKDFPGLTVKSLSKMGLRTAIMGEVTLNDCQVPLENRLGREGSGFAIFNHSMEWERGAILASAVGTMERLLKRCLDYAKTRQQFGQPIGKFQLISSKLVAMKMRLETSRALLYQFAEVKQRGKAAHLEAAMAKWQISEAWVQSCLDAIQIHGAYGYLTEFELERELRDALGSRLYSGTSEVQQQAIAQFMGL